MARLNAPRILLVAPWIVDFAAYDFWIKPVGLLMIGRILRDHGYETVLLDCLDRRHPGFSEFPRPIAKSRADGTGRFHKEILPKPVILRDVPRRYGRYGLPLSLVRSLLKRMDRPDAVLVTSGMTFWYPGVFEMIRLLRESFPGVPVALGGVYATLCADHARRQSGADAVIPGEGESASLRLLRTWTGYGPAEPEADPFPLPDYDLYPALDSAAILTSRGCPFDCPFCATHLLTGAHRRLETEKVLSFLDALSRRGVRDVAFYDDALLVRRDDHLIPLLEGIIRTNPGMRFHTPNGLHPRMIDEKLARLMSRAGFGTIRLSFETRNAERRREMGFKVSDDDLTRAVRLLSGAGIPKSQIGGYVLAGLPGQPPGEMLDGMMFVFGLGIRVSLAWFSPIPGTRSWETAVRDGLLREDADPLLTNNSIFPFRSEQAPREAFVALGTLAAEGNRLILGGGNPEKDEGFRGKIRAFERAYVRGGV